MTAPPGLPLPPRYQFPLTAYSRRSEEFPEIGQLWLGPFSCDDV